MRLCRLVQREHKMPLFTNLPRFSWRCIFSLFTFQLHRHRWANWPNRPLRVMSPNENHIQETMGMMITLDNKDVEWTNEWTAHWVLPTCESKGHLWSGVPPTGPPVPHQHIAHDQQLWSYCFNMCSFGSEEFGEFLYQCSQCVVAVLFAIFMWNSDVCYWVKKQQRQKQRFSFGLLKQRLSI